MDPYKNMIMTQILIILIKIMIRRGITESSPELADVLYQFPAHQQSKLLQVMIMIRIVMIMMVIIKMN